MHVHCGSRDFDGDVGVDRGRLLAAVLDVALIRPLPPRLAVPDKVPDRPTGPLVLLSLREYDELAFLENLKAGD